MALGTFCPDDYKIFNTEMDGIMKKRQTAGYEQGDLSAGYESDLERERNQLKAEASNEKENADENEQKKLADKGKKVRWLVPDP